MLSRISGLSNSKIFIIFILMLLVLFYNFTYNARVVKAEDKKPLTIAVIPKSLDNPIFLDALEGARSEAEKLGIKLEWVAPFSTDADEQIEIIENLIRKKVDGIIISVIDSELLKEPINKAVSAGIPVATFDSDSPDSQRLFYVGTDNKKAGEAVGQALVQVLKRNNMKKRQLDAMILTGNPEALNLNERIDGFLATVKGKVDIKVKEILACNDNIKLAIELVEEYVKSHPEIDVIFFTGGWPFYVPADAMPNFQKWAQKGGLAFGIDIFYSALVLQQDGLIQFLVGQDFKTMGERSLEYMVHYLKTGKKPPQVVETGLEYATRENIDELLDIYKPWEVR